MKDVKEHTTKQFAQIRNSYSHYQINEDYCTKHAAQCAKEKEDHKFS